MNKIIAPITPCGNAGFDEFNQFMVRWQERNGWMATMMADPRGKTCAICGKGWELTVESIKDQLTLSPTVPMLVHDRCFNGYLSMRERYRIHNLLSQRTWLREGPVDLVIAEVPNEYGGSWNTPWFKMEFKNHLPGVELVIGRRKRVWHVELRNLNEERWKAVGDALAAVEDTKGREGNNVHVHCWNEDQLTERVRLMMEAILTATSAPVRTPLSEGAHGASPGKTN